MNTPFKMWSNLKSNIFKKYSENPGTMLVHTGAIGWILSSAAQIFAVVVNEKLSSEQKLFLIPQEAADAFVNILSFYTVTNGVKYIGSKLTKTAKIRTANISKILEDRGLILGKGQKREVGKVYAGDWDFDITKLKHYKINIEPIFKPFNNGAEVIAGLIGSIISGNIITPILRNRYAANKQKDIMNQYNEWQTMYPINIQSGFRKGGMESFTSHAYSRTYPFSGNMKV